MSNFHNGKLMPEGPADAVFFASQKPFDLVCPALPGSRPNMHKDSCDRRLNDGGSPECKRCKIGKPFLAKRKAERDKANEVVKTCNVCGGEIRKHQKLCGTCKAVRKADRNKQRVVKRFCQYAGCDQQVSARKKYCGPHKIIREQEQQIKNREFLKNSRLKK
jgi:hypothetical protein